MKEKVIDLVKGLLEEGKIQGFLGLRETVAGICPHLFTKAEELAELSLGDRKATADARYPLDQTLVFLNRKYPEATFGVLVRGCDERGLTELHKWKQLDRERVVPVGIACTAELAEACACAKPYPDALVAGDKVDGVAQSAEVAGYNELPLAERFKVWMEHFDRCVKCYGCRNVCPMCFCKECSLEETTLVAKGKLPTENPVFHLTRAVHMAGRCIDCGLCEEACPADIPLRALYKKVADIVAGMSGYRPGFDPDRKSPFSLLQTSKDE